MKAKKATKLGHTVLASGEQTGHYHEAIGAGVALYETSPDAMYLSAPAGAEVTHQEHRTVALPPGEYDRRIVSEFDHFENESRDVRD